MVCADPAGSVLADYVREGTMNKPGSWLVEGIGEDFIPPIADLSRARRAYNISDRESFHAARELLRKEGVLAGASSGTLFAAALNDCRAQTTCERAVAFDFDSGTESQSQIDNDLSMT